MGISRETNSGSDGKNMGAIMESYENRMGYYGNKMDVLWE